MVQPAHSLSAEAVVMSRRILEKNINSYAEILDVFDVMIENQLHYNYLAIAHFKTFPNFKFLNFIFKCL